VVPLSQPTSALVRGWLQQNAADERQPLVPNRFGQPLSLSGVEKRIQAAVKQASRCCPPLRDKTISPHVFSHYSAMHLLKSGVDLPVIALYLKKELAIFFPMRPWRAQRRARAPIL
jgi:site-specific recombinase XerD